MAERGETAGYQGKDEVPGQVVTRFCQPCSKNSNECEASVFCLTCNEFQCKDCSNGHNIYTFMKNHKLVDASASPETKTSFDMNGLDRCDKHDKVVKFFCDDDKKLCCSTCAITEHRKCSRLDEIKNIDIGESSSNTLKVEMNNFKERNEAAARLWTDSENHMQRQMEDLLKRLDAVRTSVLSRLKYLEARIKIEMATTSDTKAREYSYNRAQCENVVSLIEHDFKILNSVRLNGTPEQLFIAQQRVKESLQATREKSSELSKLEDTEMSLEMSDELARLLDSSIKLWSVKIKTSEIKLDDIFEGRPVTLEKIVSIVIKQNKNDTKEPPRISGMDFLSDGRLVAVDNFNSKCLVYSDRLELLSSSEISGKPLDLVAMSDDQVVVTMGQRVDFLNVDSSNQITRTRTIKTMSNYNSICMKDDENFVAGTYNDMKPVRILSLCGEEKDLNIDFPTKKFDLDASACTYIKNRDKVVLIDKNEHTVYIYYVMTNTCVVVENEQIKDPRSLTVGPYDSIFVCCKGTNSVVQISHTGRILSSHQLDIEYPYRVCVSKDKATLAVSNSVTGKRKLQLFSIRH